MNPNSEISKIARKVFSGIVFKAEKRTQIDRKITSEKQKVRSKFVLTCPPPGSRQVKFQNAIASENCTDFEEIHLNQLEIQQKHAKILEYVSILKNLDFEIESFENEIRKKSDNLDARAENFKQLPFGFKIDAGPQKEIARQIDIEISDFKKVEKKQKKVLTEMQNFTLKAKAQQKKILSEIEAEEGQVKYITDKIMSFLPLQQEINKKNDEIAQNLQLNKENIQKLIINNSQEHKELLKEINQNNVFLSKIAKIKLSKGLNKRK